MPRPRPAWWLYPAAASFVGYFVFIAFANNFPPEGFGATVSAREGGVYVLAVAPGSPAEAAGIQPGDREVESGGRTMRGELDMRVLLGQITVGVPTVFEMEREGRRFTVRHVPARRVFVGVSGRDYFPRLYPSLTLGLLFTVLMGLFVAFRQPDDPTALMGAWLLASVGCATAPLWLRGTAATFRALPVPIEMLLWPACLSSLSIGPLAFTFFSIFPRRPARVWWILPLAWLPGVALVAWMGLYLVLTVYNPDRALGYYNPSWLTMLAPLSFPAYILAGAASMTWRYRTTGDLNERRRMRVLLVGALAGAAGLLMTAISLTIGDLPAMPAVVLFLLFPSSFVYAIVRHRLFDVRVIVRQGVQYALARGLVLAAIPVLAVVLVLDLLWHGNEPFIAIVQARGWIYATLAAIALLAHVRRHRWMDAIDRRFFRERYDAQRVMREVVDDVRRARGVEEAAPTVVERVGTALHPEFAAVLAREPGHAQYRTLAVSPPGHLLPPLAGDSKVVGLVRLLGRPLQVATAGTGWLAEQLPHEETGFIRDARLDLLIPVALGGDGREAVLVLGRKRSEEPYGSDDLELLSAIAASLGLLLERPVPQPQGAAEFGECPDCGRCYDPGVPRCIDDRASLTMSRFGRTLAGRYTLERRLGRGGMGTVYDATDSALERRVAVKLIRDDLVGNADAAERFRREARTAAGFKHPNVVTVHDFGVTDETRAFLVMERLDGRTLRETLGREGRLSEVRTREVVRQVGAAVDAAHRLQIVHRDLKPENIYLAREAEREVAKILDFGIAKFLPASAVQPTAETGSGVLLGTMKYMAPEQLNGGAATPLWDLWALAVVTYEMLTGAHPFAGVRPAGWQAALLAERWAPVGEGLPGAPPGLQAFFTRALAADPDSRPQSASSFVEQFEACTA